MVIYNELFILEINWKVKVVSCMYVFYLGFLKSLFMLGFKIFEWFKNFCVFVR